jgi:hypothetical protein
MGLPDFDPTLVGEAIAWIAAATLTTALTMKKLLKGWASRQVLVQRKERGRMRRALRNALRKELRPMLAEELKGLHMRIERLELAVEHLMAHRPSQGGQAPP